MSFLRTPATTRTGGPPLEPVYSTPEPFPERNTGQGDGGIPFSYYLLMIRRYRWRIITLVLVVTMAAGLIALSMPKQYEAVAIIRLDPAGVSTFNQDSQRVGADPTLLVATEKEVITSPAVLSQTVDTLRLDHNPEFAKALGNEPPESGKGRERLLREIANHLEVDRPPGTLLLEIRFRTHSAELSSQIANGVARAFLDHEYATRASALAESSKSMGQQMDSLRAAMERDQRELVDYQSQSNVLDPDDRNNIFQARLSQINEDLSKVQSDRIRLQADYGIARAGDIDSLLISDRGQSLLPLKNHLMEDQRQLDRMKAIYGPNHPLLQQQQDVVARDQTAYSSESHHIATQLGDEYHAAVAREKLVRAALEAQKAAMDDFNRKAIRYRALKAAADSATQLYFDLQHRIQDSNVAENLRSEDLRIISPATPQYRPVSPRVGLILFLAFFLSSAAGVAGAVAAGISDRTVTNPEQAKHWFNLSVIGALPIAKELKPYLGNSLHLREVGGVLPATATGEGLVASSAPGNAFFREAILSLHTAIMLAEQGRLSVLAVTSSVPGEGKSTVSAHLATAIASLGQSVVLVDADMRKPSAHRLFEVRNLVGLSSVLRGQVTENEAMVAIDKNLMLLPAGPTPESPAALLHVALPELVERLRARFDFILIDCPPVLGFADSLSVANVSDGVALVVGAGQTKREGVSEAVRHLRAGRANILGIILNRMEASFSAYYGYYKTHYNSYYSPEDV